MVLLDGFLRALGRLAARFARDTHEAVRELSRTQLQRGEFWLLLGIILLAVAARGMLIMHPFEHDEAYTVSVFAASPLHESLSDYYLPNNHLLHTLLLHISYLFFGYQPWAVRLPAFLAGILVIPALYFFARRLYDRWVALLAAGAAAAMPVMIYYSTSARGYSLVMLLALLIFFLGDFVRQRVNLLAWTLLVLCTAAGLYTIPVFFFPYGVLLVWLGFAFLIGAVDPMAYRPRWKFLAGLAVSGIATLILFLLLYTPVFLRDGVRAIFPTQVQHPAGWALFMEDVRVRLVESGNLLVTGFSTPVVWLLGIGVALSLLPLPRSAQRGRSAQRRVPLQIAALVGTFGLVFVLRAPPWARFITFLVPLILMWTAAGWVRLVQWIGGLLRFGPSLNRWLMGAALAAMALGCAWWIGHNPQAGFQVKGPMEQAALYLQANAQEQSLVVIGPPHDAELWYYFRLHGISMDHFKRELPFFQAFVLVDPSEGQTLQSVMKERMPDTFFFDLSQARVVYQSGAIQVYELIPYADMIRKEYHLP